MTWFLASLAALGAADRRCVPVLERLAAVGTLPVPEFQAAAWRCSAAGIRGSRLATVALLLAGIPALSALLREARETLDPKTREFLLWALRRRIEREHRLLEQQP